MTAVATREMIELPAQPGLYRTPFGFYVADHKSPSDMKPAETQEWLYRDGTAPIPNTSWSMVGTMTEDEINAIGHPEIREETRKAQELMLEYPAQFVGLWAVGNKYLFEPHGFGVKVLENPLRGGYIEIYDHDVSRIRIGEQQDHYNNAKLLVDEAAEEDDVRFAVRDGNWFAFDRRFGVELGWGPLYSGPGMAGLGFRPEGNQAYLSITPALEDLAEAKK